MSKHTIKQVKSSGKLSDSNWSSYDKAISFEKSNIGLDDVDNYVCLKSSDEITDVVSNFFSCYIAGNLIIKSTEYSEKLEARRIPIVNKFVKLLNFTKTIAGDNYNYCDPSDTVNNVKEFVDYTIANKLRRIHIIKKCSKHKYLQLFGVTLSTFEGDITLMQDIINKAFELHKEYRNIEYIPEDFEHVIPAVLNMIDTNNIPEFAKFKLFLAYIKELLKLLHINRFTAYKLYSRDPFKMINFITHLMMYVYIEYCRKGNNIKYKLRAQFSEAIEALQSKIKLIREMQLVPDDKYVILKQLIEAGIAAIDKIRGGCFSLPDFELTDDVEIYSVRCPVFNKPIGEIVNDKSSLGEEKFDDLFRRRARAIRFSKSIDTADVDFDSTDEYYEK